MGAYEYYIMGLAILVITIGVCVMTGTCIPNRNRYKQTEELTEKELKRIRWKNGASNPLLAGFLLLIAIAAGWTYAEALKQAKESPEATATSTAKEEASK